MSQFCEVTLSVALAGGLRSREVKATPLVKAAASAASGRPGSADPGSGALPAAPQRRPHLPGARPSAKVLPARAGPRTPR